MHNAYINMHTHNSNGSIDLTTSLGFTAAFSCSFRSSSLLSGRGGLFRGFSSRSNIPYLIVHTYHSVINK